MHLNEITPDIDSSSDALPWFLNEPREALYAYTGSQYLVVDLETTNLDKGSPLNEQNRIVCACWRWAGEEPQFAWGSELEQHDLYAALEKALELRIPIVAHAAKFELGWFKRMGFDLHDFLIYDTMLGDYVLRGNRLNMKLDLGTVARRWGYPTGKESTIDSMMKAGVNPAEMPRELLRARVIKDVRQTDFIFRRQRRKLENKNQLPVQLTRCIATPWLTDIEFNGMALDEKRVEEEYERARKEYAEAVREFEEFTGGVNHKSPTQMAHYLYAAPPAGLGFTELKRNGKPVRGKKSKQFPEGQPKTDNKTLDKLQATTAKQKKFLELRAKAGSLNAELVKTLNFCMGIVAEYDGEFFGEFLQHSTRTHRLASRGRKLYMRMFDKEYSAQFQNWPRKLKDLIKPRRKGWWQFEIDGSQLEYRTAGWLGQDPNIMHDIRHDLDIHKYSAMALYGVKTATDIEKWQRQNAKPTTFRPLYGGSKGTPGQLKYFAWWKEHHEVLEEVQKGWTYEVLKTKRLITPWGLRYYWPHTRMSADGYIDNKTSIYNYPVQALATAEIVPVACVYLWHRMHRMELQSVMVNTVHDSAIGECPDEEKEIITQLGIYCFTMDVYDYLSSVYGLDFNVPLGAGVKIGSRWNAPDATEVEVNVEQDGEIWYKGEREDLSMYEYLGE